MVKVEENSLPTSPQDNSNMPEIQEAPQYYVHTADYHFSDKEQQLRQIIKGVVKKTGFSESDLTGPTTERDIHEFMDRYVDSNWRVRVDIPVKDLRKMIPLLIMYVYNMREERSHRKVKGMWTVKPTDWPEDVPYCDPNNQTRPGLGKPKKDILMKMFMFLLKKYKETKPQIRSPSAVSYASMSSSMSPVSDTDSYTPNSNEYQVGDNQTHYEITTPAEQYIDTVETMETMETEPSTMVTMEMQEWDPSRDIMQRIQDKVHYLVHSNIVPQADIGLLSIIKDLFCKMYEVHHNALQFFLTSAHEFECTLDLVHHLQKMSEKDRLKWKDFEARWYLEIVTVANDDSSAVGLQAMSFALRGH